MLLKSRVEYCNGLSGLKVEKCNICNVVEVWSGIL